MLTFTELYTRCNYINGSTLWEWKKNRKRIIRQLAFCLYLTYVGIDFINISKYGFGTGLAPKYILSVSAASMSDRKYMGSVYEK